MDFFFGRVISCVCSYCGHLVVADMGMSWHCVDDIVLFLSCSDFNDYFTSVGFLGSTCYNHYYATPSPRLHKALLIKTAIL